MAWHNAQSYPPAPPRIRDLRTFVPSCLLALPCALPPAARHVWLAAFAVFLVAERVVRASIPWYFREMPAPARSSLDGAYRQGPLRRRRTPFSSGSPPADRPRPATAPSGGESITVTTSPSPTGGPELVFTGGGRTFRTDQCYDPLPTLHVDVHSREGGGLDRARDWRNHCATRDGGSASRDSIQSLVDGERIARELNISETGRYEITVDQGHLHRRHPPQP